MTDTDHNAMTAEQLGMLAGAPVETSFVVEIDGLVGRTKMFLTHIGVPADSPGGRGRAMVIDEMEARVAELRGSPPPIDTPRSGRALAVTSTEKTWEPSGLLQWLSHPDELRSPSDCSSQRLNASH